MEVDLFDLQLVITPIRMLLVHSVTEQSGNFGLATSSQVRLRGIISPGCLVPSLSTIEMLRCLSLAVRDTIATMLHLTVRVSAGYRGHPRNRWPMERKSGRD